MFNQTSKSTQSHFLPNSPVVRYSMFICIGIFFYQFLIEDLFINAFGNLNLFSISKKYEVWRIVTFQFLHANFNHLIGNMLMFYFFGPILEKWLGSKRFLAYYILCGAFGGLTYIILNHLGYLGFGKLVGASGGLYGILIGVAVLNPKLKVRLLFLPVDLSIKQVAWALLGIAAFTTLLKGNNAGGEACHLGGAVFGYFLIKYPKVLSVFTPSFVWFYSADVKGKQTGQVSYSRRKVNDYSPKIKPRTRLDVLDKDRNSQEVDRILDKISEHGLHSITDEEKEILKQVSKN